MYKKGPLQIVHKWFLFITERSSVTGTDWWTLRNLLRLLGQSMWPWSSSHSMLGSSRDTEMGFGPSKKKFFKLPARATS